jgi:hypothetical protein
VATQLSRVVGHPISKANSMNRPIRNSAALIQTIHGRSTGHVNMTGAG